ncbi:hypothetical protein [Empedobacter falsenii]|uniref:DUF4837 family protein n=1 Tax=Empedobacter falsenii TaxID=343874 RepID=A0AAW7DHS9_9FLAO|nr:hypothetical protein [Empedobacter falsenii]MDM1551090.1 hypothetical protein [Empedobacter falsenii]
MKKLFTLVYISIALVSCAQTETKKYKTMTENYIAKTENIYKTVKIYDYNPQYTLHLSAANFTFEVLINDFPVQKNYDPGIVTGSMPINEALLKSGKQKLTIRMTPPVDEEYNMGKEIDFSIAELKLSINYGEYGKQKVKEFKEALKYEMPQRQEKLPYYEISLEFDAPVVAYENDVKGWKESVDLSKEDKHKLQKEVEDFYKEMIAIYENKDINTLAAKYYNRQKELAQIYFSNQPGKSKILIEEYNKDVLESRPFIFSDYILKYYGNGRIIQLVKTDKYYLNFSALMREDPKTEKAVVYGMYLQRPEPDAPLEVIR